jgi:hypothetical protein
MESMLPAFVANVESDLEQVRAAGDCELPLLQQVAPALYALPYICSIHLR